MPANLRTLAHLAVSSAMNLPKSWGEPANGVVPKSASRALILGSARPALISLLSFAMISAGVFFGATVPHYPLASKPCGLLYFIGQFSRFCGTLPARKADPRGAGSLVTITARHSSHEWAFPID